MVSEFVTFNEAKEWPKPGFFDVDYGDMDNNYFAPYVRMLKYCFGLFPPPVQRSFTITPYHLPRECVIDCPRCFGRQHSLDFFVIRNMRHQIVAFAQVVDKEMEMSNTHRRKPFNDIYYLADQQVRAVFKAELDTTPIRDFWGLSFVNNSLRVYRGDNKTGEVTPADAGAVSESDWDVDILSQAGLETMQKIVKDMNNDKATLPRLEEHDGKPLKAIRGVRE